jgi:hypothetical protein
MSDLNNIRRGELKRLLRHRGVPEIEVHNAVEDIIAERRRWTATALGQRMNLAFDDGNRFGIRTFACVDRTKRMVRLYFRERKRERDRMRVNKMREKITKPISSRAKQLATGLNGEWVESPALVQQMQKRWRLKHDGLRQAVLRAARELCRAGIVEEKIGAGPAGGRVLFLRLKKPMNIDISARQGDSYIDKTGTL